jgi:SHS2 domain-containing protein
MPYRFLEDIATGDAAFEAEGRTLEELFREAAVATFEVMVDTKGVEPRITREVELKNEAVDGLLFDWLSELVYLKDAEAVLFSKFNVNIKKNDAYELKANASGENINQQKHILRSDVKAVTYHMFEVKKTEENWTARVILDI